MFYSLYLFRSKYAFFFYVHNTHFVLFIIYKRLWIKLTTSGYTNKIIFKNCMHFHQVSMFCFFLHLFRSKYLFLFILHNTNFVLFIIYKRLWINTLGYTNKIIF